jgi:DNA-binding response OmpR family regulator
MDKPSLLIIDNDENLVAFLAFFFEERGFAVHTANDGVQGIELALQRQPRVVISDMIMGEMHGFDVLERIRSHRELDGTIVIIMSAKSYRSDIERARQMGAHAYVVKPFKSEELLEIVETHLVSQRER